MPSPSLADIQSDLSNGEFNTPATAEGISSSIFNPPVEVQIDDKITQMVGYGKLQFPLDNPKYYFLMKASHYHRDTLMGIGTMETFQDVYLPLPQQLMDRQDVRWEETTLGFGGGGALDAGLGMANDPELSSKMNDLLNKVKNMNMSQSDIESFLNNLSSEQKNKIIQLFGSIGFLAAELASGTGSPAWNKLAQIGVSAGSVMMGISPNQFVTILMRGPTYKVLNFSWKLMPRNEKESEQIRKIVRFLRNCMAPGLKAGNLIFTYPKIFYCAFIPNSKYLFKFKPAVIKTLQANFAPGKVPAFYRSDRSGNSAPRNPPESIELSIQMMELEYWLRNDFDSSDDPFNTTNTAGRYSNEIDISESDE